MNLLDRLLVVVRWRREQRQRIRKGKAMSDEERGTGERQWCTQCQREFIPQNAAQKLCGACLKVRGMAAAAEARAGILDIVRQAAEAAPLCRTGITIQDAYAVMVDQWGFDLYEVVDGLGNAAGSVFKESAWEFTGQYRKVTLNRRSHHRDVKVWRLR
jgi:hypothetical protein